MRGNDLMSKIISSLTQWENQSCSKYVIKCLLQLSVHVAPVWYGGNLIIFQL